MSSDVPPKYSDLVHEDTLRSRRHGEIALSSFCPVGETPGVILTAFACTLQPPVQLAPWGRLHAGGRYQLFLASCLGVQLIMGMLSEKPRSGTPAEVAACERVQQKAAVTLARLSRDPDVAREAVRLSCEWCLLAVTGVEWGDWGREQL